MFEEVRGRLEVLLSIYERAAREKITNLLALRNRARPPVVL